MLLNSKLYAVTFTRLLEHGAQKLRQLRVDCLVFRSRHNKSEFVQLLQNDILPLFREGCRHGSPEHIPPPHLYSLYILKDVGA